MLQNNVGLLTPVNYYEDNYACKISISCQCTISLVFFILCIIGLLGSLTYMNLYLLISGLISATIYFLLYKNLKSVKDKYEKNIHPCTEKTIIRILSGIITAFIGIQIIIIFIFAVSINENNIDNYISTDLGSGDLEDLVDIVKIVLFIYLFLEFIPFIFLLLIFINSLHIN